MDTAVSKLINDGIGAFISENFNLAPAIFKTERLCQYVYNHIDRVQSVRGCDMKITDYIPESIMKKLDKEHRDLPKHEIRDENLGDTENFDKMTDDELFENVMRNPANLHYVPKSRRSKKLCEMTIAKDGIMLYCAPKEYRTQELIKSAIKSNPFAIGQLSNEELTDELVDMAVKLNGFALDHLGIDIYSVEQKFSIEHRFLTKQRYDDALKWIVNNPNAETFRSTRESFIVNMPTLILKEYIKDDNEVLLLFPKEIVTRDVLVCFIAFVHQYWNDRV